jgi:ribosome biogenesis SPOUT family RNA methylase Rps3
MAMALQISSFIIERVRVDEIENEELGEVKG